MDYNSMFNNITMIINCLCINNNFLIDIYKINDNIEIQIVNKEKETIIYKKEFKNKKCFYNSLIDDIINFYENNEIMISRLFQDKKNIYEQSLYTNNLEFKFYINCNNLNEIKSAVQRHNSINKKAQKQNTYFKKKTNCNKLIVG